MEEWRKAKKAEQVELEPIHEDDTENSDEFLKDGEVDLEETVKENRRLESKRKTQENNGKKEKSKRRKLDPLVDWGAKKEGNKVRPDVRNWLHESSGSILQEESCQWPTTSAMPQINNIQFKQLEIEFNWSIGKDQSKMKTKKPEISIQQEEPAIASFKKIKTGKLSKKEANQIASKNRKMTDWIRKGNRVVEEAEVVKEKYIEEHESMLMEIGECQELTDTEKKIIRIREAEVKQLRWQNRRWISSLVEELAQEVEGRSVAGNLVAELINVSTIIGKTNQIWNELLADNVLLNNISNKITSRFKSC